jgi:hypothetical protein
VLRDPSRVCGVDGCRGGWVAASPHGIEVVSSLLDLLPRFDLIGIDMPIGMSVDGRRACDTAARKALSTRSSTVFPVPPRSLVHLTDYAEANRLSKSQFGRGVSRQSFAIWPKIRELDEIARSNPGCLVEIHPECSFTEMSGEVPPTKHGEPGKKFREKVLRDHFGSIPADVRGAKRDDVLDAHAVLWSALRFANNTHRTLGDGSLDACGLPMRIVV